MEQQQLHTIDPLFDFQLLCDTDLGLYNLIKRDYYDKSVFDNYLFDSKNDRFIKTKLMCREYFNPLHIFCKKDKMTDKELDTLYAEFLEKEYDNILKLSPPTAVLQLASTSNSVKNIVNPVIICKCEAEKKWIEKYDSKLKCIIADFKDFNISKYDTIYIKDIYTLLLLEQKSIDLKNIIIGRYVFNLEIANSKIELPIIEVSQRYYINNQFMLIDVYKDISIPVSEKQ